MAELGRRDFLGLCAGSAALASCAGPGAPGLRAPVIDAHMHVWSDDPKRFPFSHPYTPGFQAPRAPGAVEALLTEMDASGIDGCVLVQVIYHGWDNRYVAQALKAHPARFRVQGLIDPTDPALARKLDDWVRGQGLSGMRFSPIYYEGRDQWLNAPETRGLWEKARELGAIFNFFIATPQLPRLEERVRDFPDVPVVIDHLARIDLKAVDPLPEFRRLLALARYPNVHAKVSELSVLSPSGTFPYADTHPWVRRLYDAFGPDRLLWGTGFPAGTRREAGRPSLAEELALIRSEIPFFTPADRGKILGLNAARLWKFPSA